VSLLSTAAWKLGHPSIAEAKATRGESGGGHADLLVVLPQSSVVVEAKIMWFSNLGGLESVLGRLEDAKTQIKSLPLDLASRRLALVFGVLERGGDALPGLLASSVQRARSLNLDVIVWCLAPSSPPDVQYPGCLVLGSLES
jgi:hypothetical protein